MSDESLPSWSEVNDASNASFLAAAPAELHGGLCGWLAGGRDGPCWLAEVMCDPSLRMPAPDSVLDRLYVASRKQLDDSDFGFELLLPDGSALAERSAALFAWCRGFLGGFGLAEGAAAAVSEEGREALQDLARLAAATAEPEGDEGDEVALAEIEEFVRVAVLLLHGDCVLGARHRARLN